METKARERSRMAVATLTGAWLMILNASMMMMMVMLVLNALRPPPPPPPPLLPLSSSPPRPLLRQTCRLATRQLRRFESALRRVVLRAPRRRALGAWLQGRARRR